MISIVWTKSDLPISRLIRFLARESVSHMAIVIDNKIVFHSNFYGAHLKWLTSFLKRSEVVYELSLDLTFDEEERIYQRLIHQFDEQPYDWGAIAYWFYAMLRHRITGWALPKSNPWGSDRGFLCVELAECLDVLGLDLSDLDMVTPEALYFTLKEALDAYLPSP